MKLLPLILLILVRVDLMPRHIRQIIRCLRKLVQTVKGVDRSWNRKSPGPDDNHTIIPILRDRASDASHVFPTSITIKPVTEVREPLFLLDRLPTGMDREPVSSSLLRSIGYDPDQQFLEIELQGGKDIPVHRGPGTDLPQIDGCGLTRPLLQSPY